MRERSINAGFARIIRLGKRLGRGFLRLQFIASRCASARLDLIVAGLSSDANKQQYEGARVQKRGSELCTCGNKYSHYLSHHRCETAVCAVPVRVLLGTLIQRWRQISTPFCCCCCCGSGCYELSVTFRPHGELCFVRSERPSSQPRGSSRARSLPTD